MKLSIVIPVFNEKRTLKELIGRVKRVNLSKLNLDKEIIVVDDGSTDSSSEILSKIAGIRVIRHKKNRGKGAALRTGFENATGDIILMQDADLEYVPAEIPKLVAPILNGNSKVVYGSRFMGTIIGEPILSHQLGNKILSIATTAIYGARITDMETGYKAFKSEVIKGIKLESDKFDIEPEITAKILKKGHKITEVPIEYRARGFKEGKKITWKDGLIALKTLLKYRFFS